ncbi:MAG TPA: carbohydrate kinase family protein [Nakamurella sp.]|nr:carbohydrate kinase family protein [Nakamurella sp.]
MTGVLVNGPASWNMLVDLDTLPAATPHMVIARAHRSGLGGTSAGKALNLARLGVPTTLRTVLGTDPDAAQIASALAHPRLTMIPDVVDGPSEHHLNLLSAAGERISIYLDLTLEPPALPGPLLGALQAADIAVIDLTTSSLPVLDAARAVGCEIWCDIHDYDGVADFHRPFIDAADVLIVSADRLNDPDRFLTDRLADGTSLAVCTHGRRGALAISREEGRWRVNAVPVERAVDSNGAGDAFVAGPLAARLDRRPLEECLRWASAAGALAVQSTDLVSPRISRRSVQDLAQEAAASAIA